MRTSPSPCVSANEMQPVFVQAFMWLRIRAWRSPAVFSIKLTDNCRGFGPQYLEVNTAMNCGLMMSRAAAISAIRPTTGAFAGLIFLAVSAAVITRRDGRDLGVQT